jgi:hypothetical protein
MKNLNRFITSNEIKAEIDATSMKTPGVDSFTVDFY